MIVICYSMPIFMTVILPLSLLYWGIQKCYISTSRQLQRLEAITISPVFSHFSESLHGASSIRAYGQTERFIDESETKVWKEL